MMVAGVFWRLVPLAMRSVGEFQREITLRMTRGEWAAAAEAAATCRAAWPSASAGWLLGSFVALAAGENEEALRVSEALWERGLWVPAIRPPTVPRGSARLRITLTAAHTETDVDALLAALSSIAESK